jgi:CRISPR-associated protein Cas1
VALLAQSSLVDLHCVHLADSCAASLVTAMTPLERRKPPHHPVNAMLNYAYAVLESQVRIAAVSQGLDPTIAYLHTTRPGRVALVYDLM